MKENLHNDRIARPYEEKRIADYLLDRLPDDAREQFEDDMMADEALFEVVEATEQDLLLRYVRDAVSPADRLAIEQVYSKNPRAHRLAEARSFSSALDRIAPAGPAPQRWWAGIWPAATGWRFAVATASVAVLFLLVYKPADDPRQGRTAETPVAVWSIAAGRTRAADTAPPAIFQLPRSGTIRMEFPGAACEDAGVCRVSIAEVDATAARWTGVAQRSEGGPWSADVPGIALVPGDYIAEVTAANGARTSHQMRIE